MQVTRLALRLYEGPWIVPTAGDDRFAGKELTIGRHHADHVGATARLS